jgi:hypothetical protein
MDGLSLAEIYSLERTGLIFTSNGKHKLPSGLIDAASEVRSVRKAPAHFEAPTATAAAAWLACTSCSVSGQTVDALDVLDEARIGEGTAISFRGQAARYGSLVPTFCRVPYSIEEQKLNENTLLWFWPALQYLHNQRFRYDSRNRRIDPTFWIGEGELLIAAQHHGMKTRFIDWTFDPRVALVFAAHGLKVGEQGVVCIRGAVSGWAVLPPSFLRRLWQQSGFVVEEPCACRSEQRSLAAGCSKCFESATSFHRITFSVADESEKNYLECQYRQLMKGDCAIERLLRWCSEQAASREAPKHHGLAVGSLADLDSVWNDNGIDPEVLPIGDEPIFENVDEVWSMFEKRALRLRDDKINWDVGLLASAVRSVSIDCTAVGVSKKAINDLPPMRRRLLNMASAGADHLQSVAKCGGERYVPYFV